MKKTFIFVLIATVFGLSVNLSPYYKGTTYAHEFTDIQHFSSYAERQDVTNALKLNKLGINLHPGTSFKKESYAETKDEMKCKSLAYQTLVTLPEDHREHLNNLTLYFADGRRGLGGGSTIILRCSDMEEKEIISVLVHEMGHVVDTGLYTGDIWKGESAYKDGHIPIYNNDLSIRFYRISWDDENTLKKGAKEMDFVSRYGMTDPFEDFAETYNYYILHGSEFRLLKEYNRSLERKYLFMKYYIFEGKEFGLANDREISVDYMGRPYDTTVLNYDLLSFLDN